MEQKKLPRWLRGILDFRQIHRLERITAEATAPHPRLDVVVAKRSHSTGHVFLILSLILIIILLPLAQQIFAGDFLAEITGVLTAVMISFIMGGLLSGQAFLQRLCTQPQDLLQATLNRAQIEFYQNTHNLKMEALLFISLMERRAVLFVDSDLSSRVEAQHLQQIVNRLLKTWKLAGLAQGIEEALTGFHEISSHLGQRQQTPTAQGGSFQYKE